MGDFVYVTPPINTDSSENKMKYQLNVEMNSKSEK